MFIETPLPQQPIPAPWLRDYTASITRLPQVDLSPVAQLATNFAEDPNFTYPSLLTHQLSSIQAKDIQRQASHRHAQSGVNLTTETSPNRLALQSATRLFEGHVDRTLELTTAFTQERLGQESEPLTPTQRINFLNQVSRTQPETLQEHYHLSQVVIATFDTRPIARLRGEYIRSVIQAHQAPEQIDQQTTATMNLRAGLLDELTRHPQTAHLPFDLLNQYLRRSLSTI